MKGSNRNQRAYKVADEYYEKAKKKAEKNGGYLANLIENVVICYSFGLEIKAVKMGNGTATALDIFSTASDLDTVALELKKRKSNKK